MEKQDRFYKGLFWGTLIGSAVGVTIGMLFAPRKGDETRRDLQNKLRRYLQPETPPEPTPDVENTAKEQSDAIVENAREQAQSLLDDADNLLREIRSKSSKN